jgi:hypothetical protein
VREIKSISMRRLAKRLVRRLPLVKRVFQELDQLRAELEKYKTWVPPGHYYSPIPSLDKVRLMEERIFDYNLRYIPGIDLNEQEQLSLLNEFKQYYDEQPFEPYKTENSRYFFENSMYSYSDAIFLYCMIRHAKPDRIIEVGSGYSSCVILDTNELFFDNAISCTFIDPYPERFLSLLKDGDQDRVEIITKRLQDVDSDQFLLLSAGDILLVDSTHVSKVGSDVNHVFFDILPGLNSGVYIHFHDVFYPFEYPKEWIYQGRAWNEIYLLRAFLQYNEAFRIIFFNTFLERFFKDRLVQEFPLCIRKYTQKKETVNGSIWLRKN